MVRGQVLPALRTMANAYQVLSRCCWNNAAILRAVLKLVILSIVKCSKAQLLQHVPASDTWSANVPQINGYCLLQRKACLGMNQLRARLYSWYLCDCHRRLHCSTPTLVTHIVTWAWAPKSPFELPQSTSDLYTESKTVKLPWKGNSKYVLGPIFSIFDKLYKIQLCFS